MEYIVLAKRKFSNKEKEIFSEDILAERISMAIPEWKMSWKITEKDKSIVIIELDTLDLASAENIKEYLKQSKHPKYSDIKIYKLIEV